jgi:hypothetical protein
VENAEERNFIFQINNLGTILQNKCDLFSHLFINNGHFRSTCTDSATGWMTRVQFLAGVMM